MSLAKCAAIALMALAGPRRVRSWRMRALAAMRSVSATRFLVSGRLCLINFTPLICRHGANLNQETKWSSVRHGVMLVPSSEIKVAMVITSTPSMVLRLTPQIRINSASKSNLGWFFWDFRLFAYSCRLDWAQTECWGLIISVDDSKATSLEQIRAFLAGSGEVRVAGQLREEVYAWAERTLVRHQYASLGKLEKGMVRR
jgi:hypothetical protein